MRHAPFFKKLLVLLAFFLPYSAINAWNFIPSAILIIALMGPKATGLNIPRQKWGAFAATLLIASLLAHWLILNRLERANIQWTPKDWSIGLRTRPVFQCLVEEMVLRALLLSALLRSFKAPRVVSVLAALLFALLHPLLYQITHHEWIDPASLATLFGFGLLCNELYLRQKSIATCYALHLGWNLTRFGGDYIQNGERLSEPKTYHSIEATALLIALALAAGLIAGLANRRKLDGKNF